MRIIILHQTLNTDLCIVNISRIITIVFDFENINRTVLGVIVVNWRSTVADEVDNIVEFHDIAAVRHCYDLDLL